MQLYPWQKECLRAWEKNGRRGIAHVVTGAGKTVLALEAIRRMRERYPETSIRIVTPSIPLAHQWKSALLQDASCAQARPGVLGGGRRDDPDARILIYIVNTARETLAAHIRRELSLGRHVLLICDECHHYASPQNRRIFDFLTPDVLSGDLYAGLGLSATPLGTENDAALIRGLGPVIYRYALDEAVQEGILSSFAVCEVSASFRPEELAEYGRLTAEISVLMQKLFAAKPELKAMSKKRFLQAVSRMAHEAQMSPEDPAAAFLLKTYRRKEISVLASSRIQCGLALLERLRPEDRVIVFSERISQAEAMAAAIRRRMGDQCALYHSGMTKEARARNLSAFRERAVRILVSCRCLDEGVDVPDAQIGVILSGSAVERQHIQRLGRLIRRAQGKDAACLYHVTIREAMEDSAFLPGLTACDTFSLRFYPAEGDFSNDLYECAAVALLSGAKKQGMPEAALREIRACLAEGLPRADCLLPGEALHRRIKSAASVHERNYWRVMKSLHRELSFRREGR